MGGDEGRRVLDVLEAEGPELPVVVLARRTGIPPSRLIPVLDDLHDIGLVTSGRERASVALVPAPWTGRGPPHLGAGDPARGR